MLLVETQRYSRDAIYMRNVADVSGLALSNGP